MLLEFLVVAIFAIIVMAVVWFITNKSKNRTIDSLQATSESKQKAIGYLNNELAERTSTIRRLNSIIDNIEDDLPSNLVATNINGEVINYYRVREVDEKDKIDGLKKGDKFAHVNRKIKGEWTNVPVKLRIKRQ